MTETAPSKEEEAANLLATARLIITNIEEHDDWLDSKALVTAHAHAAVLAADLPDALEHSQPPQQSAPDGWRERADAHAWSGIDIMKLALIEDALEASVKRAAILRTETVHIQAPQARELLTWAKERSIQLLASAPPAPEVGVSDEVVDRETPDYLPPLIAEFERREDEFREWTGTLQWVILHKASNGDTEVRFAPTFEAAAKWCASSYGPNMKVLIRQIDAPPAVLPLVTTSLPAGEGSPPVPADLPEERVEEIAREIDPSAAWHVHPDRGYGEDRKEAAREKARAILKLLASPAPVEGETTFTRSGEFVVQLGRTKGKE